MPDDRAAVRAIAHSIDPEIWPSLVEHAARHGLLGVFAQHLNAEDMPATVWASFTRQHALRSLWSEQVARSLEDVASAFAAANLRVCALKGPALSARLYGDRTTRFSTDLDLLVAYEDLERAVGVLTDHGYIGESATTTAYLLRHSHHLYLEKPNVPSIELHFQTYVGFGVAVPSSALMDRAVEYALNATCRVWVPSPEDEFIYLAIHAAGHNFVRLQWLYDLKVLLARNPRLDWQEVIRRSKAAGIVTAVGYAVRVLVRWLGMPLKEVLQQFPGGGVRVAVADAMLVSAATESARASINTVKGLFFTAMLCDREASTLWVLQHHLLRSAKRRAHRVTPRLVPASWAG